MNTLTQQDTPIRKALEEQRYNRLAHFDVPGHKGGRGNKELRDFLGEECMRLDMNSMKPLDNLCHPVSVIKEAQELGIAETNPYQDVEGLDAACKIVIIANSPFLSL